MPSLPVSVPHRSTTTFLLFISHFLLCLPPSILFYSVSHHFSSQTPRCPIPELPSLIVLSRLFITSLRFPQGSPRLHLHLYLSPSVSHPILPSRCLTPVFLSSPISVSSVLSCHLCAITSHLGALAPPGSHQLGGDSCALSSLCLGHVPLWQGGLSLLSLRPCPSRVLSTSFLLLHLSRGFIVAPPPCSPPAPACLPGCTLTASIPHPVQPPCLFCICRSLLPSL